MKCDENLVKRAIAGDINAFGELYKQIYGDMYKFSYLMLGNKDDAVDAVSDAVADIYRYIGKVKNSKAFSAWCMKILWTKCKQKRKEYVEKYVEVSLDDIPEPVEEETYIENVYLKYELMKLGEEERTIILLNFLYGYTSKEIGKFMNLKAETVRSKQSRAMEKLRERMVEHGR